ncbi:hypothetical protein LTR10_014511 [Elasticomyces elasticus]|uniref:Uncharacterized protein n=1 Tax=Exophiala sideris TaxID=1016849 RepID=A0ABR0JS99_9EURO|nr:hypothetical protein LTR10_014511 [Elasticomyces elasticus]KAK5040490.1 hypothetical protein LTS07_000988 [Exophiala sideris]KAK5043084.1 hypothetical protein LTR13_000855 [Exophiala sideris]KAK5068868.1 hypothetical protein LTR69_000989 [Exophiala sideris]KAK5186464.1 hypothetical protein LTR44_001520 [Eurotiomycetes sp. CCFEE 6388]
MSATAGPLLNDILPHTGTSLNEASEFEKILRIRDEVFSGSHPRLTVPSHALRLSASQTPAQSHLNVPPPFPTSASPNRPATTQSRREEDATQVQVKTNGLASSSIQPASSNVSEFDPIFLTKSDDLVRAEIQLKRQRLEKALKEQFEHKRQDARRKPAPSEAKPDFDLPAILAKVLNPVKSPSSKDEADASDSVDENSFYSSRAPDSTPEGPDESGEDAEDAVQADERSGPPVVSAVMGSPLQQGANNEPSVNVARLPQAASAQAVTAAANMDLDDEEEEGEYSPPEATAYPASKVGQPEAMQDTRDPRGRPLRRYSETEDNGRRPLSPSEANMRINGRRQSQRIGRPGSPQTPDDFQGLPPRKRRKLEKRMEKKARRNGAYSPGVKEENISPPPFHDVQPLGSGRIRPLGDRPIVIDDEPEQEVRYMPPPEQRYVDSPSRPIHRQVEQLMPLSEPRASSRASVRPMRDDQDLRRVASMHNMRTEAPREYVEPYYETPTRTRAVSYARVGSPAIMESPRHPREVPVEYDRTPQEARVVRTPAPVYREIYDDAEPTYRYVPEPMPPPPVERIVVDQYGRRFREIVQERPSAVPRAMSVRREVEPSYENYRSPRAGSVFVDAGPERVYQSSDMPPPPVTYRRAAELGRPSAMPGPASREYFDPGSLPRSSSVQVMDRPPRATVYADERPEYREPIRMASVRPPETRYEEVQPMEMMARPQSVRPIAREGSVFHDRAPVSHEYVPVEQPRYRAAEPAQRYYDPQGREIITMDGTMDGRQRVVERY